MAEGRVSEFEIIPVSHSSKQELKLFEVKLEITQHFPKIRRRLSYTMSIQGHIGT